MRSTRARPGALAALLALVCACGGPPAAERPLPELAIELTPALETALLRASPLPPVPPDPTNRVADDPQAARYGQALFHDARFSRDGSVACATCHQVEHGLSDGRQLAFGLSQGNRHTPTLWNAAYHRWLTWDGRADSLWMQALDPPEDPREMDVTRAGVVRIILRDPDYRAAHAALFGPLPTALDSADIPERARPARPGDPEGAESSPPEVRAWAALSADERTAIDRMYVEFGKALAAYQRRLVRGDAPFDRFVRGLRERDGRLVAELSPAAQRGAALFFGRANCVLCHSGPNFSDGEFHNNSLPTLDGQPPRDSGRYAGAAAVRASPYNAEGPFSDARDGERALAVRQLRTSSETWGEFRTPSLRNLAGRAPFMHEGQFADLPAVVHFYDTLEGQSGRNHHQERLLVPLGLSEGERADLLAFLGALEGAPLDARWLGPPR